MSQRALAAVRRALRVTEKDVVRDGDRFADMLGFTAVHFSQARATQQTEGIPDRRYYHVASGVALWWEAKAPDGTQRAEQRAFQVMCEACGEMYVLGGLDALIPMLTRFARRGPNPLTRAPREAPHE